MNVTGPGLHFRLMWLLWELLLEFILEFVEHPGVKLGALVAKTAHRQLPTEFCGAAPLQFVSKLGSEWGHILHKLPHYFR